MSRPRRGLSAQRADQGRGSGGTGRFPRPLPTGREGRTVAAALAVGAGVTWNVSNVGAIADPLADEYGVGLGMIGLFTTALFVTHVLVQVPAGRGADGLGPRRVAFFALVAVGVGNVLLLLTPSPALALLARAIVGLGSGAGFVAGAELMRATRPSPVLQGLYGGSTMAGGSFAIAIVPQLEPSLGWRAPYWSALVVALVTAAGLAATPREARAGGASAGRLVADRRLLRLAALHASTFAFSVVAANWIVTLLERQGHPRSVAGVLGSFLLLAGIVTRPLGGVVSDRRPVIVAAVLTTAAALALLALPLPIAALGLAAAVGGLAAGLPFAAVFAGAQRLRPDAPGAAVGYVNAWALTAIVVGTPLVGLSFSLPGEGRLGFACLAVLAAAAALLVPMPPRRLAPRSAEG